MAKNTPAAQAAPASRKTECPITRDQFKKAVPITVKIGDFPIVASPKEFSTGSVGFYANGKSVVEIDGVPCQCQVGVNITVVGSKELPA